MEQSAPQIYWKMHWIIIKLPVCIRLIYLILLNITWRCSSVSFCHTAWAKSIAHFLVWSVFFFLFVVFSFVSFDVVSFSGWVLQVQFCTLNRYSVQHTCRRSAVSGTTAPPIAHYTITKRSQRHVWKSNLVSFWNMFHESLCHLMLMRVNDLEQRID